MQEKQREKKNGTFRPVPGLSREDEEQQLKEIMRPVTDSYQNRDYKQIDRDLVYSVLDLTVV